MYGSHGVAVQFRILGPLEVWLDGYFPIRAAKHRSLLAALLLGANKVQSVDRLIDMIWGERPPNSARNLVSVYVHQLRKLISEAGLDRDVLVTSPPGYVLRIAPAQLDLLVFERLTAEAREAAARLDHVTAAAGFREALALWRGPVLSDIDRGVPCDLEILRLEETRLAVIEECVETELVLGRHARVVGELESLVRQHPFRERLHGMLMLALYRSGRRGEAIRTYQTARKILSEELGLEPGHELQRLIRSILADDDSHGPPAAPITCRPSPPRQTPSDVIDFTGREAELDGLRRLADQCLSSSNVVPVVVTGPPGVGKSALTIRAAHELRSKFPGGQLYADLRGSHPDAASAESVLAEFLVALGTERRLVPGGFSERLACFRTLTADSRLLVVLDDARDEAQVRPLLPTGPGSMVIASSRSRLAGLEGSTVVDLGVFDTAQATGLLEKIVGGRRVRAERDAALQIVELCNNLPLAVRIAGARLAAHPYWPLARLARQLANPQQRLDHLAVGDLTVRESFALSRHRLDPRTRTVFQLIGLTESSVTAWAVARMLDCAPATAERLLEALVDAQLTVAIGRDELGQLRYRQIGLLRDYARELPGLTEPERRAALSRLLHGYLAAAQEAAIAAGWRQRSALLPVPGPGLEPCQLEIVRRRPLDWFRAEADALRASVGMAHRAGLRSLTWRLAVSLAGFFRRERLWADWEQAHQFGLAAAESIADRTAQATVLSGLADLYILRSHWSDALTCLDRCHALFAGTGDVGGQAGALHRIGDVYQRKGSRAEAAKYHDRAAATFVIAANPQNAACAAPHRRVARREGERC